MLEFLDRAARQAGEAFAVVWEISPLMQAWFSSRCGRCMDIVQVRGIRQPVRDMKFHSWFAVGHAESILGTVGVCWLSRYSGRRLA